MDPAKKLDATRWVVRNVGSNHPLPKRIAKLMAFFGTGNAFMNEVYLSHCETGALIAQRLGFEKNVQDTVRFLWERWDGRSQAFGLKGEQTPISARILHLAQVMEVGYRAGGLELATGIAKERRGKDFDPTIVSAFETVRQTSGFWSVLESPSMRERVLAIQPDAGRRAISESDLDNVCEVLADFVDIKTVQTWGHSKAVALLAEGIGRQLGVTGAELAALRRAALVHDLGNVMVPCATMEKEGELTLDERERVHLHPYYTDRILSRVDLLSPLAADASAHHEQQDGDGYYRQLTGDRMTLNQRILAIANHYAGLVRGGARTPEEALSALKPDIGRRHDSACYDALSSYLSGDPASAPATRRKPAGLSDREIEVIQCLALGMRNKEIAAELVISEKTVERHLENVFNKLGVRSRTSAVVYGVQYGLVTAQAKSLSRA